MHAALPMSREWDGPIRALADLLWMIKCWRWSTFSHWFSQLISCTQTVKRCYQNVSCHWLYCHTAKILTFDSSCSGTGLAGSATKIFRARPIKRMTVPYLSDSFRVLLWYYLQDACLYIRVRRIYIIMITGSRPIIADFIVFYANLLYLINL